WIDDALPPGAKPEGNDGTEASWKFVAAQDAPVYSGEKSHTRTATGLSQHFFTGANPTLRIGEGDRFFAYVYLDPANPPREIMLQWNDGQWEHRAIWGENLIAWGADESPARFRMGELPKTGEWVRLEVDAATVGLASGSQVNGWAFTQFDGTVYWDKAGLVTKTPQAGTEYDSLLAWSSVEGTAEKPTAPAAIIEIIKKPAAERSDEQQKQLQNYFVENVYSKSRDVFVPLQKERDDLNQKIASLDGQIPATLVMEDLPTPKPTFVLTRGEYDKPDNDQPVVPDVPSVLPALPVDAPRNRLTLAKWLVDPAHPLTSRVAVNRFWQQYFGQGIVRTTEDFGSQGEWPSHPELLDWLAVRFVESGWDIKAMQRLIVTSATFRQSAHVTEQHVDKDPENILLARGPRHRMDAEMIRDNMLAISGLLVRKIGGKSVRPYQPDGIWEAVAFTGSNTMKYTRDEGNALFRRSIYTFWKRTAPPPAMTTFDAPSREACTVKRARTNTPLQALALMNDEQYVEAARHLAERMMTEATASPQEKIAHAFKLATARTPTEQEMTIFEQLYQSHKAEYDADPEAALKLVTVGTTPRDETLSVPDLATWTMIANLILNLDETITN
ncbi:MAG: DUF1553 domain-containing protein, partial [Planctomycetota bacterium]|nr:DUF1553 domain-containing protein [Planctomycetota bacterium]